MPLDADKHCHSLFENFSKTPNLFDYLLELRPTSVEEYRQRLKGYEQDKARQHWVIELLRCPNDYIGLVCLANPDTKNKTIELSRGEASEKLRNSPASTETLYLMCKFAFDTLGYNRMFGVTSVNNAVTITNMDRVGFVCEGYIRNGLVIDGYAIDGQMYSLLQPEWPALKKSIEAWFDPSNFDSNGKQRKPLKYFREIYQ